MRTKVIEADKGKRQVRYGLLDHKVGPSTKHVAKEIEEYNQRLDLLFRVSQKIASVSGLTPLLKQTTQMTQHALKASASSVLLFDEGKQELFFKVAEGKVGKVLKKLRLDSQSGIVGWVVCHGKPLIINDVRKDLRFNEGIDEITGFITRSIMCVPLVVNRKTIGVVEVLNKQDGSDFNGQDLEALMSVASTTAIAIENTRLHQSMVDGYKGTIEALAAAIDAKDPYTCGHSQRVTEYALLGGISLSLSREELEVLEYAGILHDIGKIGISDRILCKPGRLTPKEWDIMRRHSAIGANILKNVPFLQPARELILHHHERYDGSGYPDGLKGEEIPIGARLLGVADAFDTMTTSRSYCAALDVQSALEELRQLSGTQFCPVAVDAFISGFNKHHQGLSSPIPKF